ncbi:enoyl-CoA hydratase [Alicycliphilus sp. B1]|nr:enoyl-CoA hydratase [Alicycliphilus sp. B1]
MPTRTKLSAKVAVSAAMRMSHIQVRSSPAPMAGPLTAQITGTSEVVQRLRDALYALAVFLADQVGRERVVEEALHVLDVAARAEDGAGAR